MKIWALFFSVMLTIVFTASFESLADGKDKGKGITVTPVGPRHSTKKSRHRKKTRTRKSSSNRSPQKSSDGKFDLNDTPDAMIAKALKQPKASCREYADLEPQAVKAEKATGHYRATLDERKMGATVFKNYLDQAGKDNAERVAHGGEDLKKLVFDKQALLFPGQTDNQDAVWDKFVASMTEMSPNGEDLGAEEFADSLISNDPRQEALRDIKSAVEPVMNRLVWTRMQQMAATDDFKNSTDPSTVKFGLVTSETLQPPSKSYKILVDFVRSFRDRSDSSHIDKAAITQFLSGNTVPPHSVPMSLEYLMQHWTSISWSRGVDNSSINWESSAKNPYERGKNGGCRMLAYMACSGCNEGVEVCNNYRHDKVWFSPDLEAPVASTAQAAPTVKEPQKTIAPAIGKVTVGGTPGNNNAGALTP